MTSLAPDIVEAIVRGDDPDGISIVRNGQPWLPVEVKYADTTPSPNWSRFLGMLPCRRAIQVVSCPAWQQHRFGNREVLVAGAAELLDYLV